MASKTAGGSGSSRERPPPAAGCAAVLAFCPASCCAPTRRLPCHCWNQLKEVIGASGNDCKQQQTHSTHCGPSSSWPPVAETVGIHAGTHPEGGMQQGQQEAKQSERGASWPQLIVHDWVPRKFAGKEGRATAGFGEKPTGETSAKTKPAWCTVLVHRAGRCTSALHAAPGAAGWRPSFISRGACPQGWRLKLTRAWTPRRRLRRPWAACRGAAPRQTW